jgi:hypothetical protein
MRAFVMPVDVPARGWSRDSLIDVDPKIPPHGSGFFWSIGRFSTDFLFKTQILNKNSKLIGFFDLSLGFSVLSLEYSVFC